MAIDHFRFISDNIRASILVKEQMLQSDELLEAIGQTVSLIILDYKKGGKVLFCGNGGSAADAQHLSAELSGRFRKDRPPLFAEALHVNTSFMTAVANDYSYAHVYARMLGAMGSEGDVLIAISTSGQSENIIEAAKKAREMNINVVGLTGGDGGALAEYCDIEIRIPSYDTARIQEGHILAGHLICELVEAEMFPDE
ncbi:SIS domain-containing protein [Membranicola marinus]|uniref:Phosphoheptose isomerase n=1 Tax=Membranihabitans marinus TaxID=1227546 RepID=A0A953HQL1_9BACT|nr:SIS domain-containing protein [Membranihabitans marinus]MBY5956570.1 SIS domain-containing protein [Membranihabitans marinus]